jgi:pimeloyl-ACP methyl ester carboxylesterase
MSRPLHHLRKRWKWIATAFLCLAILVNLLAARHARAFLEYAPAGDPPLAPEQLSRGQKFGLIVNGLSVPRPENQSDPASVGMAFTSHRIVLGDDWIEVWEIPTATAPHGSVLLFPGYSMSKAGLLEEGWVFHKLGFRVVLVDFRGAGGSSGSDTTLGIREADDVEHVVQWSRGQWPESPIVLFGRSMGAAAVLRAARGKKTLADALTLECPFDTMLGTVQNRFASLGLPSFPGAHLLVFWGGRRIGANGFAHNPVEYAREVDTPTLLFAGSRDTRATPEQVKSIFDALPCKKQFVLIDAGHEPFRARDSMRWDQEVQQFLAHLRR